uniref:Uncharacterized protein n=1 Tax=Tanacetum cinerariifolium TaxID=118510 RepID=A0A699GPD7_TANCI|nr:hypothetical protein [Tanacetum cinerariifolium]
MLEERRLLLETKVKEIDQKTETQKALQTEADLFISEGSLRVKEEQHMNLYLQKLSSSNSPASKTAGVKSSVGRVPCASPASSSSGAECERENVVMGGGGEVEIRPKEDVRREMIIVRNEAPDTYRPSHLDMMEGHNEQVSNDCMESRIQQLRVDNERQKRDMETRRNPEYQSLWMSAGTSDDTSKRLFMELLHQKQANQPAEPLSINSGIPFERRQHSFNISDQQVGLNQNHPFAVGYKWRVSLSSAWVTGRASSYYPVDNGVVAVKSTSSFDVLPRFPMLCLLLFSAWSRVTICCEMIRARGWITFLADMSLPLDGLCTRGTVTRGCEMQLPLGRFLVHLVAEPGLAVYCLVRD